MVRIKAMCSANKNFFATCTRENIIT
jgi:hypothetical protein